MDTRSFSVLSVCSGGGGLDLGLRLAIPDARVVCYVENEAFACEVLASRMGDGALDDAPVWTDLRTFDGRPWRGVVDCVAGGYPCQPFSCSGRKRGADDPRHLWPHVAKIVRECGPSLVFFENVENHLRLGFESVRDELRAMGYLVEAGIFSAQEVGAPHLRKRLFVLGGLEHAIGQRRGEEGEGQGGRGPRWPVPVLADAKGGGRGELRQSPGGDRLPDGRDEELGTLPLWPPGPGDERGWEEVIRGPGRGQALEPSVRVVADGVADGLVQSALDARTNQLRLVGNGVVPACAAVAYGVLLARLLGRGR